MPTSKPENDSTPTLALSQHHELLHEEGRVLIRPSLDRIGLSLISSKCESLFHSAKERLLLKEGRHYSKTVSNTYKHALPSQLSPLALHGRAPAQ